MLKLAQAPGACLLVGHLKTSSLDSGIILLQINVTFYDLKRMRQNFINLPFLKLSFFWNPLKHENLFN